MITGAANGLGQRAGFVQRPGGWNLAQDVGASFHRPNGMVRVHGRRRRYHDDIQARLQKRVEIRVRRFDAEGLGFLLPPFPYRIADRRKSRFRMVLKRIRKATSTPQTGNPDL